MRHTVSVTEHRFELTPHRPPAEKRTQPPQRQTVIDVIG
jgi:hypothetical protein